MASIAEFVDVKFDFRSDTPVNGDPDALSPTLRRYHQMLWGRALPSGANTAPRPRSRSTSPRRAGSPSASRGSAATTPCCSVRTATPASSRPGTGSERSPRHPSAGRPSRPTSSPWRWPATASGPGSTAGRCSKLRTTSGHSPAVVLVWSSRKGVSGARRSRCARRRRKTGRRDHEHSTAVRGSLLIRPSNSAPKKLITARF